MNLENIETFDFPFKHWEIQNCVDEPTLNEISFADIPDGKRVYDGTRAADDTGKGQDGKLRLFVTKDNAKSFIRNIEDKLGVSVTLIGTGPRVNDVIDLRT